MKINSSNSKNAHFSFRNLKPFLGILILLITYSCKKDDGLVLPSGPGDFITSINGVNISGTLFLPEGNGPFPAIVVVPGSGNEPKEEDYAFADLFVPAGFAVYFYDKRGIGASTGSYPQETLENPFDFLNARRDDVLSIIDMLNTHTDIQHDHIGLSGASQGTWVNALVYEQSDIVDFMIMTSGGLTSTGVENFYDVLTDDINLSVEDATQQLYNYDGVIGYDPLPTMREMNIPVAFIFGGKDRSHPSLYEVDLLEMLNKPNFSVSLFDNSDHSLIDVNTGTFDPGLIPFLISWLNENGK